ncbi:MAG: CHASE2 domain-containing protein, partial [Candidatus Rokuibacteriota bacterium]
MARQARRPLAIAAGIALLVGLAVLGLRTAGLLESLELAAYDAGIRLRPLARTPDPRVVLVTVTEHDIQQLGRWPLPDGVLARALETLLRGSPRAIGLDIYRDVPVPPGTDALRAVLTGDSRVVAVMKFSEGGSTGVRPPAALDGTDQVGFNDVIVDPGGIVRRGLLFLDDGATVFPSFALRLALLYLQPHG